MRREHKVGGIEYCLEHGGILTEGTDYHPEGLGCQYAERDNDQPCRPADLFWKERPC